MKDSIFSNKRILLLGSGELGKELVIESKRLGLEVIAIDRYEKAPAMQVADYSRVIDMGDKNILKNVIKEFKPDYVVPEIEKYMRQKDLLEILIFAGGGGRGMSFSSPAVRPRLLRCRAGYAGIQHRRPPPNKRRSCLVF